MLGLQTQQIFNNMYKLFFLGQAEIIEILLKNGANQNIVDYYGKKARDYAEENAFKHADKIHLRISDIFQKYQ